MKSSARASETNSVAIITSASGAKNCPVTPPRNVSGRNVTIVVSDEPIRAGVIDCQVPAATASARELPLLQFVIDVFSTTTMPSSMTMPIAIAERAEGHNIERFVRAAFIVLKR